MNYIYMQEKMQMSKRKAWMCVQVGGKEADFEGLRRAHRGRAVRKKNGRCRPGGPGKRTGVGCPWERQGGFRVFLKNKNHPK